MPLQYENGTVAECKAVRERSGLFDVSHLGRVWLRGEDAARALRSVSSYDALSIPLGRAHYSLYCNESGGIEDDVFIYHLPDDRRLVVHNAANEAADLKRLREAAAELEDATNSSAMLAVQGPLALGVLETLFGAELAGTRRNECLELDWRGGSVLFARTGYTGEDGGECVVDAELGAELLEALIDAGVEPVGLAARDILRLEASLPLHGNDIGPDTNPFEAGLKFATSLDDAPFTGKEVLQKLGSEPTPRKLACIEAEGRAVFRAGYAVVHPPAGENVAELTSGAFSPTLGRGIGMAYLPTSLSAVGTELAVRVRSNEIPAKVVRRPFYKRRG